MMIMMFQGTVDKLANNDYHIREQATEKLIQNLPYSLPAIFQGMVAEDAEVVMRSHLVFSKFLNSIDLVMKQETLVALIVFTPRNVETIPEYELHKINNDGIYIVSKYVKSIKPKADEYDYIETENGSVVISWGMYLMVYGNNEDKKRMIKLFQNLTPDQIKLKNGED